MKKFFLSITTSLALAAGSLTALEVSQEPSLLEASAKNPMIGVVNFGVCMSQSKLGKKEWEQAEMIGKQMASMIEETEKEIQDLSAKFEDTEYLDSLSPKAEEELKVKFQTLQEQHGRYQNQYYQVINQVRQQVVMKVGSSIAQASEKLAKELNLDYVMNQEACFFVRSDLDLTPRVIEELDRSFETAQAAEKRNAESLELHKEGISTELKAGG